MHALVRWWHRSRLRDRRYAALFERYRGNEVVALDLETTGLDPRRCEILSIAAVPLAGNRVQSSAALVLVVRGEQRIDIDSMRHHQLRPLDLAHGVDLDEALERLLTFLGNRPILGYHVDFDAAVLSRELQRRHGFPLPNRRIDLDRVFEQAWRRAQPEREPPGLSFEQIATTLGIPQLGRHDALGDAVTTALCYVRIEAGL